MHTPIGVVASTFVILTQEKRGFPRSLSKRLDSFAPLLVVRIGAVLNHLASHHVIDHRAQVSNVQGKYPNVVALGGDYGSVNDQVKSSLQALSIPAALAATMQTIVGMHDAALSAGFDKAIGVATGAAKGAYKKIEMASKVKGYGQKALDTGKKTMELRTALKNAKGDPVDLFISIM